MFPGIRLLVGVSIVLSASRFEPRADEPLPGLERFYIGTYSGAIRVSTLNLETGALSAPTVAASIGDPSFLALTPDRKFLYAVNEGGGTVGAFSVNPTSGALKLLNQRSSNGGAPAHIVVDGSGRNVIVANYSGGSVSVFPILTNGQLGVATARIQHPGSGPLAHCTTLDASNRFAFVCDKGLDQVRSYLFDPVAGTLVTNKVPFASVPRGSGPRHMTFDLQYKRAYVICELSSTIIGFNYDAANGVMTPFQTNSTLLPGGFTGANTTAEIVMHPSGKFLYGSNRGKNTIAVFSVNEGDGTFKPVQQQTPGATPRKFAIDPTGRYCIVAGQSSNDIRLYTIDPQSGQLSDTGQKMSVSAPVCIVPFILQPPQPILAARSLARNALELNVGHGLDLLTYQVYQSAELSANANWNLLATGRPGQTNFLLTNTLPANSSASGC
jgi:6-phosphogluconolactonase